MNNSISKRLLVFITGKGKIGRIDPHLFVGFTGGGQRRGHWLWRRRTHVYQPEWMGRHSDTTGGREYSSGKERRF